MLQNFVIGAFEDKTTSLLSAQDLSLVTPFSDSSIHSGFLKSSQPLSVDLFLYLKQYIDAVTLWNLTAIITVILNFIFSYILFRKFNSKLIAAITAVIYACAPYGIFKLENHIALACTWILPLGITLVLYKWNTMKQAFVVGVVFGILFLYSNYYGYFLFLFICMWTVFDIRKRIVKLLYTGIIAGVTIALIISPYVLENITLVGQRFSHISELSLSQPTPLKNTANIEGEKNLTTTNTIEDFFYFTARPWYFFLWPVSNPIYGNITKRSIDFLQNEWGHWLAQNYYMREHSAAFLGITNFVLALIGAFMIFKREVTSPQNKNLLKSLLITAVFVFLFTLPPYIKLAGIPIYLPSYLLSLAFPMFRVLVRMSLIILLIQLIFTGYGIRTIVQRSPRKLFQAMLLTILLTASLSEFIVFPKIIDIRTAPEYALYIRDHTSQDSVLVSYPDSDRNPIKFWVRTYQRKILNVDSDAPTEGFYRAQFTKDLTTCAGLIRARHLGTTHLLFIKDQRKSRDETMRFFDSIPLLEKTATFAQNDSYLYTFKPETTELVLWEKQCITQSE